MKILIVGTGVIGTLYAHALSDHHDVTHFVRENKFNIMNKKTIPYDIIDEHKDRKHIYSKGEYTYKCVTTVNCDYDLIIVPVNTYQLSEALETLIKQAPDAHYLVFALNWNGTEEIDSILKKEQYIMGYAGGGGTFKEDLLWGNIGKDIILGTVYEEQRSLLRTTIGIFEECSIKPEVPNNVLHWLWIHNIGATPMGVGLSKYNDVSQYLKDKRLIKTCFKAMNECYSMCDKRGVNLKKFPQVKVVTMPFFIIYPMFKRNFEKNPVMQRFTSHALLAIDEMKFNFKQMLQLGKEMGIDMPNMEELNKLI